MCFTVQLALNDPSLWIEPISWRPMFTEIEKTKFNPRLNYKEVINSIWRGTPNETESDRCLSAIVRSSLNVGCQIPETCAETLIRDDGTTGYPLTHRLLMVQVAKAVSDLSHLRYDNYIHFFIFFLFNFISSFLIDICEIMLTFIMLYTAYL